MKKTTGWCNQEWLQVLDADYFTFGWSGKASLGKWHLNWNLKGQREPATRKSCESALHGEAHKGKMGLLLPSSVLTPPGLALKYIVNSMFMVGDTSQQKPQTHCHLPLNQDNSPVGHWQPSSLPLCTPSVLATIPISISHPKESRVRTAFEDSLATSQGTFPSRHPVGTSNLLCPIHAGCHMTSFPCVLLGPCQFSHLLCCPF